jgi:abortive infection bacteriophage resistance protein
MQQEYLNSDETADQKLKKLRDQWNPLLDPVKRDNLVEDVNSLCRDMLRRMRYSRTMQAPDRKRIEEIAKRIAGNTAFDRITRRKAFEMYLKLYLLTVLQRM